MKNKKTSEKGVSLDIEFLEVEIEIGISWDSYLEEDEETDEIEGGNYEWTLDFVEILEV